MANLPISSMYRSTPALPVSDEGRNTLVARLNAAFTEGAVDSEAYHRLLDLTFGARTLGELLPVVEALPPTPTYAEPGVVAQTGRPGELSQPLAPRPALVAAVVGAGVLALVIAVIALVMLPIL